MSARGFAEEPPSPAATERLRAIDGSAWAPVTVWQTYTDPVRLVEIHHTDLTVSTEGQARSWAEYLDLRAVLHADGRLVLLFRDGQAREVAEHDVRVRWPAGDRYSPFPDAMMPEGRARPPAATSAGPDHAACVEDPGAAALSLSALAALPDGAGRLARLTSGAEQVPEPLNREACPRALLALDVATLAAKLRARYEICKKQAATVASEGRPSPPDGDG